MRKAIIRDAIRSRCTFSALAISLMISPAFFSLAQEKKPKPSPEDLSWVDGLTRIPPGEYREIDPVALYFSLSWNNVLNAGNLALALEHSESESGEVTYIGRAEGGDTGLARALWSYDVKAKDLVDPDTLRPHLFELTETENEKEASYSIDFQEGKVIAETTAASKEKAGELETRRKVYRYDFLQDILSMTLYVRSQPLKNGDQINALVSPFNRPYHVEFKVAGREVRKIRREKYETIRLRVEIRKVNHDKTLQKYDKLKTATLWITDDEFRLPIELNADIFIGFVSARMTDRTWLTEAQTGIGKIPDPPKKKGGLGGFLENIGKAMQKQKAAPAPD